MWSSLLIACLAPQVPIIQRGSTCDLVRGRIGARDRDLLLQAQSMGGSRFSDNRLGVPKTKSADSLPCHTRCRFFVRAVMLPCSIQDQAVIRSAIWGRLREGNQQRGKPRGGLTLIRVGVKSPSGRRE